MCDVFSGVKVSPPSNVDANSSSSPTKDTEPSAAAAVEATEQPPPPSDLVRAAERIKFQITLEEPEEGDEPNVRAANDV